jgi:molecular chaperone GrpE (heat shock protein)
MREKPFIVQFAEFISGYSSSSREQEEALCKLEGQAKNLIRELDSYKAKSKDLSTNLTNAEKMVSSLNESLLEKSNTIDSLKEKLKEASELIDGFKIQCEKLNEANTLLSSQQNNLVGNIISGIQNSELFLGDLFSKEQVIQFLNTQLEQLLQTMGISVFEDIDIPVNPLFHKIEATTFCEDISKEGFISKSLGKGFRIEGKCIQEQPVEIYTHNI